MRTGRDFFERDVVAVAKDLLGCFLIRESQEGKIIGKIVETEAYNGPTDGASHSRFGITKRNAVMFGPAGILYVYLIYGNFDLTNIVTGKAGEPSAVLLRSIEIISGQDIALANAQNHRFVKSYTKLATGPGKLSAAFNIRAADTGLDLIKSDTLYLESKVSTDHFQVIETTRIGVDYAGAAKDWPWRFYIKDNPYVSKPL